MRNSVKPLQNAPLITEIKIKSNGRPYLYTANRQYLDYKANLSTCLRYNLSGSPIAYEPIDISIIDTQTLKQIAYVNLSTDYQGCFNHTFNTKYEQFKYSHWEKKQLKITLKNNTPDEIALTQDFYLNPWEMASSSFGVDPRYNSISESPTRRYNQIHIDQVTYVKIGNDLNEFKVNDLLELTLAKTYQVILAPKVDRKHLFFSSKRYEPIPDGQYKLKFILLAPRKTDILMNQKNYKDFDYISGFEQEVTAQNGIINAIVSLPVKLTDLPRLATRTLSILKIEPIKKNRSSGNHCKRHL